jgi:hypothetical protein
MPLGKLIYMPEESTPTVATLGNREAVAYLELGDHTDHYGRLFAKTPEMLDKLFNIKRLAESGDHNGYEPNALLDLIAHEARAAVALADPMRADYIISSSHGELTMDALGYVIERRLDNDNADGGGHLACIARFDLAEWRKHWSNPETNQIDILDLGYWHTDPETGEAAYEPPDARWRTEIAEILRQGRVGVTRKEARHEKLSHARDA